ncbi:MBL fold metallo-hydrolase [Congregibacter sp.]|jgi:glyoxylase-like metal-dependent hydrolase (beta-lactamase superfamily II)|uniref:MBL fold metallo-hydrolase n=1 Tax=Congregibacter sp. TaxID=2744308 RepID=UPI0039E59566
MKTVRQPWFHTQRIRDDLYCISEPHYTWQNRANLWLIKGRDSDLLIDTGLGVSSLKLYLADLLDKPLKVVASHVHFDHSGGCHEFEQVYIHQNEHHALCSGDQRLILSAPDIGAVPDRDFDAIPYQGFSANHYEVKACPHAQAIEGGDVIDLGDKAFEVMHLPGHSSGSIGLYNTSDQSFFSGDVVYDGELLDKLEDSIVEDYITSMERLLTLKTHEVRPGHYQSFDRRRLQLLIKKYIDEKKAPACPSES